MSKPGIVLQMQDTAIAPGSREPADWLLGDWILTRVINDGAGHFHGTARFAADPDAPGRILWHEHGRLRLGAHDGPAERTLRVEPTPSGAWEVRFADGRPFHRLDLSTGSDEVTHLCGADTYRGRYTIETPDRFATTWRVTGPRKDDVIRTRYERAA